MIAFDRAYINYATPKPNVKSQHFTAGGSKPPPYGCGCNLIDKLKFESLQTKMEKSRIPMTSRIRGFSKEKRGKKMKE